MSDLADSSPRRAAQAAARAAAIELGSELGQFELAHIVDEAVDAYQRDLWTQLEKLFDEAPFTVDLPLRGTSEAPEE